MGGDKLGWVRFILGGWEWDDIFYGWFWVGGGIFWVGAGGGITFMGWWGWVEVYFGQVG